MAKRFLRIAGVPCLAALLIGCGGGGGGDGVTTQPTGPGPGSLSFAARVDLPTEGIKPGSVVIGDFNGDGKQDIAVSNFMSNTVAVFLNQGDGTFGTPVLTSVNIADGLGTMVAGDFDEDGKLDLIVGTISGLQADIVLLGNGDGTFDQQPAIPNTFGFLSGQVADLNGDGHKDVVTGGNGFVAVLLGDGHGGFTASMLPSAANPPGAFFGIAVADFNGDQKLDIVAADLLNGLVFFAGNGNGTFQAPISAGTPFVPIDSLASGDFNGDGKVDILMGVNDAAFIGPGNGNGTFQTAMGSTIGVYGGDNTTAGNGVLVRTADLNVDGKPDAIAADYDGGTLAVVLNGALGTLPPAPGSYEFTIAPGLNAIATGDLNGDGLPDIVVTNGEANQISIFLSQK
jgi:FG-GAP-like repeat